MDCERARLLLLQSDDPRPAGCSSPELAAHVRQCLACRRLAGKLAQLEEAWRELPLAGNPERGQRAFLKRLARDPSVARRRIRPWRATPMRWAAAAMLMLVLGLGTLMLLPVAPVQAAPDLVERLVDWNLDLAQAADPADRSRIHGEHAAALADALKDARLPDEDRQLAERLLESGSQLARMDDPLVEADHLNDMTDILVIHLQHATNKGNNAKVNQLARQFNRVTENGLTPRMQKIAAAGAAQAERLERFAERRARQAKQLEKMLEKAPKGAHKELKKAVDGARKQPKNPRKAK